MDVDAVAGDLTASALAEARRMNLRIDDAALARLRALASRAAREIAAGSPTTQPLGAVRAREAFKALLEEVARQPSQPHGFVPAEVSPSALDGALSVLCPIWPFC